MIELSPPLLRVGCVVLFAFLFSFLFCFPGLALSFSFFFFFFCSLTRIEFFFFLLLFSRHDFSFLNKFGWIFLGYLPFFFFKWILFFNNDISVNSYKLVFFHQHEWRKLESLLSSYFSIPSLFFIFPLFHIPNQSDPKIVVLRYLFRNLL